MILKTMIRSDNPSDAVILDHDNELVRGGEMAHEDTLKLLIRNFG
jgi:hypothetical protein